MAPKKILIVDDEAAIVEVLTMRLTASGYGTCSASDGEEAIEKVKSERPDLIIMDVLMPRMTGFEALKIIRGAPESYKIPALVISAKGSVKDYFTDIIGVEFLAKPYNPKELIARIEDLIGGPGAPLPGPKCVILAGVEDPLVGKIRDFLSRQSYEVLTALNEEDAFLMAKNFRPSFILCQFLGKTNVVDPKKLSGRLAEHAVLVYVPLYVLCKEELFTHAVRIFKEDRLITYNDNAALLKKLGLLISRMTFA